ncbi:hypothetical protein MTR67_053539 [Solanum verrucosum]|uniref:Reverse transcriptase zinc-binding domain-containing protein n=2 Tax=Solanum verrucosum TaxID=315347 RepID=A0AAF1A4B2_SOLVR|nr:hypothetical protein MTR67_053539 [Solanum verrucosum]
MPLGAKSKSIDIWNSVIEKCEKKLAKWKSQYLSKGGRLTLINSVLDALPTYMMSLFPIPPGRNFLWQGNKEKKSFHLVKWEEVMTSKENGGLGIKNLKLQSKALSMKWLWKYANNNQMLWREVIGAKYEKEDNWITKEVTTPYGVSLWRSIRSLWNEVKSNSKAKVMDGNKTRFWKDIWHEKGNMEDLFPDIYNLIMLQQSTIADLWSPQGWNFIFRRNLNDWEIVRVAEFLNTVNTFTGLQPGEDKLWWTGDDKGVFKVNKSYKLMDQIDQQCSRWPWKQIWKSRIPHKVSFFVWSMAKEAVLTQDNVMKRGRTLCSRCFLCGETSEPVNHLFLHCKYTHHLWRIFLSLKGISWTMPRKVAEALLCWEEAGVHAKDRGRWRIIPGAIWWAVWKERNSRCFESIENNVQKVKLNCILLLVFWCNQLYSNDTVSIIDVLDSI